jgi:hypothetical protein
MYKCGLERFVKTKTTNGIQEYTQMKKNTLSICVPTLGIKFAEIQIQLEQIENMTPVPGWHIEFCISVSRHFSEKFASLSSNNLVTVVRALEDAPVADNIISSINGASGDFILLMGDDDLIMSRELERLILHVSSLSHDFALGYLELIHNETEPLKRIDTKRVLSSAQAVMRGAVLPGILFRRSTMDANSINEWVSLFPDSIYPQVWLAFEALRASNSRAISIPAAVIVGSPPVGVMGTENVNRLPHYGVVERLEQLSALYIRGDVTIKERIRAEVNLALWASSTMRKGSLDGVAMVAQLVPNIRNDTKKWPTFSLIFRLKTNSLFRP